MMGVIWSARSTREISGIVEARIFKRGVERISIERWSGARIAAPKWSRALRGFGFIDSFIIAPQAILSNGAAATLEDAAIKATWYGLRITTSDGVRRLVATRSEAHAILEARATQEGNARAKRRRGAIEAANLVARQLATAIPPGRYVTHALRQRWRAYETAARNAIASLNDDGGKPGKRFVRLASWARDSEASASAEREAAARASMRKHRALLDSIEREPLTLTQRRAVVSEERRIVVNAGAGCGKTGTIIARGAYRVDAGFREPREILALTFTRKAAAEMRERLEETDYAGISARTYHSLAAEIAMQHRPDRDLLKLDREQEREAVRAVIDDLIHDAHDSLPAEFMIAHLYPYFTTRADGVRSTRSFIDYLKSRRIESVDGKSARSPLEAALLNCLYLANVPFRHRPRIGRLRPTVVLDDGTSRAFDVKIVDGRQVAAPFVPPSLQGNGGRDAMQLSWAYDEDGIDFGSLRKSLGLGERITQTEIDRLASAPGYEKALDGITKLVLDFMRRFRASALSTEQLRKLGESRRNKSFLAMYEMVELVASEMLERARFVDFDGLIREATDLLKRGRFRAPWRDLILDEYQDVSEREIQFLEAFAEAHEAEVFAVGDDWQAIYGFKGSSWDAIQTFGARFGGGDDFEQYIYPETHRSVDAIHEPAGEFIRKNRDQTPKILRSTRESPREPRIEIHGVVDGDRTFPTKALAEEILRSLAASNDTETSVLVLARAKKRLLKEEGLVGKVSYRSMTIHGAKGLGEDVAIITDALSSFPSKRQPDPLLALVQRLETFENAEERRVLYVALTRARDRVFILTDWNRRSSFLEEFRNNQHVVFVDEPPPSRTVQDGVPCPECECGHSIPGNFGMHFCSNYPYCDFKFHECACGAAIVVANGNANCSRCGREYWACWLCGFGVMEYKHGRKAVRCSTFRSSDSNSCNALSYVNRLTERDRRRVLLAPGLELPLA